jgi:hypothetical protein
MKKLYSIVLMAAALLVSTNAWATVRTAGDAASFKTAWEAAEDGDIIQLTNDVKIAKTLWLGTANMNDAAKSLTLDLNGWTLTNEAADLKYMIVIGHGELNVITSRAGGQIIQNGTNNEELFRLHGSTYRNVNPKTAESGYFTHLTIAAGVTINAKKNAIVADVINAGWKTSSNPYGIYSGNAWATAGTKAAVPNAAPYSAQLFRSKESVTSADRGLANGVRLDIHGTIIGGKYAIKTNGTIAGPANPIIADPSAFYKDTEEQDAYASTDSVYADYTPFVHIYGTASLSVPASNTDTKKPVAAYCSGYARWLIEGTCVGSTGVYVKSGEIDIHDATIQSNYTGTYVPASTANSGSGVVASGSAIVMESNSAYAGNIDVNISGDTKVTATNGYAIDEAVTYTGSESKVDAITITGGSFQGGTVPDPQNPGQNMEGVMNVSDQTAAEAKDKNDSTTITIIGAVTSEGSSTIGDETLAQYLSDQETATHITYVQDESGKTTMVISQGEAPATDPSSSTTSWSFIKGKADEAASESDPAPSYQWTAKEDATIASGVVKLGELQINAGTGTAAGERQQLTIASGATLQVERLVMNAYARIIVEAGATFIVTGGQGITDQSAENIVLKTSADAPATFLFAPSVSSNRHPNATVKMLAKQIGYVLDATSTKNWFWHRYAMPVEEASGWTKSPDVPTAIYEWSYANDDWANCGVAQMKPFLGYILTINESTLTDVEYTFEGALAGGNSNANLKFQTNGFHFFGNSYTGHIYVDSLTSQLMGNSDIDGTVWVWYDDQNYHAVPLMALHKNPGAFAAWQKEIAPMQTFVFKHNVDAVGATELNYESAIWKNPRYNSFTGNSAPRRRVAADNNTHMRVVITAENGKRDDVLFLEDAQCTDGFEKGYDAAKYMNENALNMFASVDGENYSVVATDDLEGKTLTINTVEEVNYIMSFENVNGEEYAIRDNVTGAFVTISEGATYEFAAQPNAVAEGRFEIVSVRKVTTALENAEVKANAKGIYTIMGQYVGEDFNALPAGVYVVDGVKIVK